MGDWGSTSWPFNDVQAHTASHKVKLLGKVILWETGAPQGGPLMTLRYTQPAIKCTCWSRLSYGRLGLHKLVLLSMFRHTANHSVPLLFTADLWGIGDSPVWSSKGPIYTSCHYCPFCWDFWTSMSGVKHQFAYWIGMRQIKGLTFSLTLAGTGQIIKFVLSWAHYCTQLKKTF